MNPETRFRKYQQRQELFWLLAVLLWGAVVALVVGQTPPNVNLFPPLRPSDPLFAPTNRISFGAGYREPMGQWALLGYTNQSRFYENGIALPQYDEEGEGDAGFARAWNIQPNTHGVKVAFIEKCFCYTNHPDAPVFSKLIRIGSSSGEHGHHMSSIVAMKSNNGIGGAGNIRDGGDFVAIEAYSVDDYANAVHQAIDEGVRVIIFASGYSYRVSWSNAFERAWSNDVAVIVAAPDGTSEEFLGNEFPAGWAYKWPNIRVVTASRRGLRWYDGASWSATKVHWLAPGRERITLSGSSGYTYVGGSSFSAGDAGSAVAMVLARHPDWTIYQAFSAIDSTCTQAQGYDGRSQFGGINVLAALLWSPVQYNPNVTVITEQADSVTGGWLPVGTNVFAKNNQANQGFFRLRIE